MLQEYSVVREICSDFGAFTLTDGLDTHEVGLEQVKAVEYKALERENSMVISRPTYSELRVFGNGIHNISAHVFRSEPRLEAHAWHHIEDFPFICDQGVIGYRTLSEPAECLVELAKGRYAIRFYARELHELGYGDYALDIWPSSIPTKRTHHHTSDRQWLLNAT